MISPGKSLYGNFNEIRSIGRWFFDLVNDYGGRWTSFRIEFEAELIAQSFYVCCAILGGLLHSLIWIETPAQIRS